MFATFYWYAATRTYFCVGVLIGALDQQSSNPRFQPTANPQRLGSQLHQDQSKLDMRGLVTGLRMLSLPQTQNEMGKCSLVTGLCMFSSPQPWSELSTCSPVAGLHMFSSSQGQSKLSMHCPVAELHVQSSLQPQSKVHMHSPATGLCMCSSDWIGLECAQPAGLWKKLIPR